MMQAAQDCFCGDAVNHRVACGGVALAGTVFRAAPGCLALKRNAGSLLL